MQPACVALLDRVRSPALNSNLPFSGPIPKVPFVHAGPKPSKARRAELPRGGRRRAKDGSSGAPTPSGARALRRRRSSPESSPRSCLGVCDSAAPAHRASRGGTPAKSVCQRLPCRASPKARGAPKLLRRRLPGLVGRGTGLWEQLEFRAPGVPPGRSSRQPPGEPSQIVDRRVWSPPPREGPGKFPRRTAAWTVPQRVAQPPPSVTQAVSLAAPPRQAPKAGPQGRPPRRSPKAVPPQRGVACTAAPRSPRQPPGFKILAVAITTVVEIAVAEAVTAAVDAIALPFVALAASCRPREPIRSSRPGFIALGGTSSPNAPPARMRG